MSPPNSENWNLGWVLGARGLDGELKFRFLLPDPNALDAGQVLVDEDVYRIINAEWIDERNVNVRLAGVRSRNAAHALKGKPVSVDPGWFTEEMGRPLSSFLGLTAVNHETGETIGAVTEVAHNGAQVILVLGQDKEERLIPMVDEFVAEVTATEVRICPIPGLLGEEDEN